MIKPVPGSAQTDPVNRSFRYQIILLLLPILCLILCTVTVSAASGSNGWKTKNGYDYYDRKGKHLTGQHTIKKKTYYFNSTGRQYHGWKKLGKHYSFFSFGRKANGCMLRNTTRNGFRIDKDGHAVLTTTGEKERMKAFVYLSSLLQKISKPGWKSEKKLKALFDFARELDYSYDDTDKTAAECVLKFKKQIDGDCADTNTAMAFAGALLGLRAFVVNDYGHWWAVIEGRIYDTNFGNFAALPEEAILKGFPYQGLQAISPDSASAGTIMMTVHPERYSYNTSVLTIYDRDHDTVPDWLRNELPVSAAQAS